jgi:hypothetical protein
MDWQPIKTAPKDGTEFIAWGYYNGTIDSMPSGPTWTGLRWWVDHQYPKGIWSQTLPGPMRSGSFHPTHWMPLPAPPTN